MYLYLHAIYSNVFTQFNLHLIYVAVHYVVYLINSFLFSANESVHTGAIVHKLHNSYILPLSVFHMFYVSCDFLFLLLQIHVVCDDYIIKNI